MTASLGGRHKPTTRRLSGGLLSVFGRRHKPTTRRWSGGLLSVSWRAPQAHNSLLIRRSTECVLEGVTSPQPVADQAVH